MTRTTDRKPSLAFALALLLAGLLGAAPLPAAGKRFFAGAACGYFYPGQEAFREVYDRPAWPLELRLGWAPNGRLDLWGGARYLRVAGNTVPLAAAHPEETYPVRLQVLALRLGSSFWLGRGRIAPFVGAGAQYAFFQEKWTGLPIETRGNKAGFFAQAGTRFSLGRDLSATLHLEYSFLPAGKGSALAEKVDLGGLGLALGVRAAIF